MHNIDGLADEINHYFMNSLNTLDHLVVANSACVYLERRVNKVAYSHLGLIL